MVIRDYYAGVQQALGNPFVRTNRRISTLTNGANPSWDRPDIVDFGNVPALVYEIKPRGSEPVATTEALRQDGTERGFQRIEPGSQPNPQIKRFAVDAL